MVQEAIRKADALVEALPYIMLYRGKTFVIKFGGSAMDDTAVSNDVLEDLVFLAALGIRTVLVHGGGPEISAEMAARGIQPTFVAGNRKTDEQTLKIAIDVLAGRISARLIKRIEELGGHPVCSFSNGKSMLKARKRLLEVRGPDGTMERHDLGFVGQVTEIDTARFEELGSQGSIIVAPPIAEGEDGQLYNVNADSAAAAIAIRTCAEKIVMLTNVPGILTDEGDPDSVASTLNEAETQKLIESKVIYGGMLPKVAACLEALKSGVRKAHIVGARINHAILLEIFTDKGIGTQILH